MKVEVLEGHHFLSGDVAVAEGAIAAGCRFFAGYPITPSSEVAERMSRRLPEVGGIFIQMEDELASMAALLGASWGGKKSMTATSGPGFSLMMENYGLGMMTETPCVIVNVQRAGPSTGLPTLVGQGDVMQARWGSHGPYETIALSPESPQECFDMAVRAFNFSEKYRIPVVVLMDESVGHLFERVSIPPKSEIEVIDRKISTDKKRHIYEPDDDLIPPMPPVGEGFGIHVTGLTHDERGYPVITAEAQEKLVRRLVDKIRVHADEIIDYEEFMTEDADVIVIAYGISARSARRAVIMAREKGIKAGMLRLKVIWPFPSKKLRELVEKASHFVVAEINNGQILVEVERAIRKEAVFVGKMGGEPHRPDEVLKGIEEAVK